MSGEEPTDKSSMMNLVGKVYLKDGSEGLVPLQPREAGTPLYLSAELPSERAVHHGLRGKHNYDITFSQGSGKQLLIGRVIVLKRMENNSSY